MESIRIRNLRSLVDTGEIQLKPITLLVGHNSSGKSTFLRTFPLLRQSIEARTTGPLLWFGPLVDFGDFADAVSDMVGEKEIKFDFKFSSRLRSYGKTMMSMRKPLDIIVSLSLVQGTRPETTRASGLDIALADHMIRLRFDTKGRVTTLTVNDSDFSSLVTHLRFTNQNAIIPIFMRTVERDDEDNLLIDLTRNKLSQRQATQLSELLGPDIGNAVIESLMEQFIVSSSQDMLFNMQDQRLGSISSNWLSHSLEWNVSSMQFLAIRDMVIANSLRDILRVCDQYMASIALSSMYIGPLRATAERYYRFQSLAVDEVDFRGQNLAMVLRNLSYERSIRFNSWTEEVFGFTIETPSAGGHVSVRIREGNSKTSYNLADMGFGFSQLLPVITQLWLLINTPSRRSGLSDARTIIYTIEQPELHLHPQLQAKLADAFLAAVNLAKENGLDLKLVIETHSETMVNRLGHRVATGQIDSEKINLVLFEKDKPDSSTVVRIGRYTEKGVLENWPFGFFEPDDL